MKKYIIYLCLIGLILSGCGMSDNSNALEEELVKAETTISDLEIQNVELKTEIDEKKMENASLNETIETLITLKKDVETSLETMKEAYEALELEVNDLRTKEEQADVQNTASEEVDDMYSIHIKLDSPEDYEGRGLPSKDYFRGLIEESIAIYLAFSLLNPEIDRSDSYSPESELYRIDDPRYQSITTLEALRDYISIYYSDELTEQLLSGKEILEKDGALYTAEAGIGTLYGNNWHLKQTKYSKEEEKVSFDMYFLNTEAYDIYYETMSITFSKIDGVWKVVDKYFLY